MNKKFHFGGINHKSCTCGFGHDGPFQILKKEINYLTNQINFINLVKSNSKIFNLEENKIIDLIIKSKIKKHNNSFDYLINMSFKQLSIDNVNRLFEMEKTVMPLMIQQHYIKSLNKYIY
jgi:hypothetical protein